MQYLSEEERLFWYYVNERHRIYLRRTAGELWPWTTDPILQKYKFTNVYRQLDRVTQEWLKRKEQLGKRVSKEVLFAHLATFRMFNWPQTYDYLVVGGALEKRGALFNLRKAKSILHGIAAKKGQVFTGAYIITNNGQARPKIDVVCDATHKLIKSASMVVTHAQTMEGTVDFLSANFDLVGRFIAYELACDMRFTKILDKAPDTKTWANPGPGAARGLNRIHRGGFRNRPKNKSTQLVREMRELFERGVTSFLEDHITKYQEWPFEMREIEHSLCEFDKYMRVKNGEGKPRSKYKGDR